MEKCLHILPMNKLSGAEKMALLICKNMNKYQPIVVCGGENLKAIFEKNNIKSYALDFSTKKIFGSVHGLKKVIKENNIKIVHAHDNNASLNAYLVKKIYGVDIKIISHIHSCYPWLKTENLNKKIDSYLRPKYDYNIACGNLVYNFYKENTNYFIENKSSVVSNAIDVESINNIELFNSEGLKKEYSIPKEKVVLGFVGRLCEIKGIIPFIKRIAIDKKEFKDCKILLVGSGNKEKEIRRLIKELDIEDLFVLTGFQENVYKFYNIIDIFFIPSLYEGLPMVLLEAMAFKKPVVSMNVGSISEVINEENGKLIDIGDYKEFTKQLVEIKNNRELINVYGENSYKVIKKNYNIRNYIKIIEKRYNDLSKVL